MPEQQRQRLSRTANGERWKRRRGVVLADPGPVDRERGDEGEQDRERQRLRHRVTGYPSDPIVTRRGPVRIGSSVDGLLDTSTEFGGRAERRLREERLAWLTTVDRAGTPQPILVWFLWDGADSILVYSRPDTPKLRSIANNPRVSLHLDGNGRGGDIVVATGEAALSDDPPAHEVPEYVEKYAERLARNGWSTEEFAADLLGADPDPRQARSRALSETPGETITCLEMPRRASWSRAADRRRRSSCARPAGATSRCWRDVGTSRSAARMDGAAWRIGGDGRRSSPGRACGRGSRE